MKSISHKLQTSPGYYIWLSVLLSLMTLGLYSALMSFIFGLEIMEFEVAIPWEMLISTYVFFVVSSTGLCIVTSIGHVFGRKDYELIGKRGVFLAIITIIFGMIAITLHLGHPERSAVYIWLTPNIRSAIWGMGFFYTFYIVFIMVEYWLLARADLVRMASNSAGWKSTIYNLIVFVDRSDSPESVRRDHRWARIAGVAALIAGLSAHSTLGSVFGHVESGVYWYGAYYPVYFLLSAAFSGLAWIIAVIVATYWIRKEEMSSELKDLIFEMSRVFTVLLGAGLLFTSYKMGFGLLKSEKTASIMLSLNGPLSVNFWLFEVAVGTIIPIFILLYSISRKSSGGVLAASVMTLTGVFFMRYDFVIAGQVYPVFRYSLPSTFIPTFMEMMAVAGIFAGFFFSYTLAVQYLPLKEERH